MGKNMKKKKLFYEQKSLSRLLFEQEEDVFADVEEEAEEEPSPEEEAAETEAEGEEGAAEDAEAGEDEGEDEGEEDDEKLDIDPEEEVKLSKSIDQDLEALLIDFEAQARKSKEIDIDAEETGITVATESLSLKMLIEQDAAPEYESEIDLDRFTSEVARLVKNYTSLLDMEKMLINKAREFVLTRYGQDAETSMLDILASKHDIEIVSPNEPVASDSQVPIAVGAGTPAGGA